VVTPGELDTVSSWIDVNEGFQLTNRKLHAAVTNAFNLDPGECDLVLLLSRSPQSGVSMSTLAREIGFTSGGLTKVADRLARRDLVQRVSDASDRRTVNLALTEAGVRMANDLGCLVSDVVRSLWTDVLGVERATQLAESMAMVRDTHRDAN
jgi:DNA-binding MarR family transcriptional regulator